MLTPATLTAQDIAALTLADAVSFEFNATAGVCTATAINTWSVRPAKADLFTEPGHGREKGRRTIGCAVEIIGHHPETCDDVEWTEDDAIDTVCRAQVSGTSVFWQTFTAVLKPGHELTLMWWADSNDANGDVIRAAGLTVDEFSISVRRPGTSPLWTHHLTSITRPDDAERLVTRGALGY